MPRIESTFSQLAARNQAALIPFITAGDPRPNATVPLMHELVRSGADLVEIGVPFSDPMADGPVIQQASERALAAGVSLLSVLDMVAMFRRENEKTPVVLMGYLNPIERMGYSEFAIAAADAGVDGVITVDLPPEEGVRFYEIMRTSGIDPVFLLAPTTTAQRIATICEAASGFMYYVSLRGVTGASNMDVDEVKGRILDIKQNTEIPIGVGFGIRDAATAAAVAEFADAVVVGSALVEKITTNSDDMNSTLQVVSEFMGGLNSAVKNARS